MTDNKPPTLKVATYLKVSSIGNDKNRLKENLKNNLKMLESINLIQRTTGFTDNHLKKPMNDNSKSKAKAKLKAILDLENKNKDLLKKINEAVIS